MIKKLSSCPACGKPPYEGLLSGWFYVYKCNACENEFCRDCKGNNHGKKCPGCGSSSKREFGKCG